MINEDVCHNFSPYSEEACSILLQGTSKPFVHELHWSPFINWRGDVDAYHVERADENLFIPLRETMMRAGNDTNAFDLDLPFEGGIYLYKIRAKEGKGSSEESLSNEIELTQSPFAYIPNAFTPNDDGTNETWSFATGYVKTFEVVIYNRWGQLIFTGKNANATWDGTYNGKAVPQDVYYYKITITGFDSQDVIEKTGMVTVVR
jgi:gliding motility-associated-like protein